MLAKNFPTRMSLAVALAMATATVPAHAARHHRAPTSGHHQATAHVVRASAHVQPHKLHGQQSIAPERATEIQAALIREHYMMGAPSGTWDSESETAMQKFQADQGWQTKLVPDSRALIKLGLGPDHSKAINAASGANFNVITRGNNAIQQNPGLTASSGVNN